MSYGIDGRPKREQLERHKVKYIPMGSPDGDNKPKDDKGNVELTPKSKHGGGSDNPPFVRSLEQKKKKKPGEPDDETLDDLSRLTGYRPQGAYVVDSHTYYTDSTGNRY